MCRALGRVQRWARSSGCLCSVYHTWYRFLVYIDSVNSSVPTLKGWLGVMFAHPLWVTDTKVSPFVSTYCKIGVFVGINLKSCFFSRIDVHGHFCYTSTWPRISPQLSCRLKWPVHVHKQQTVCISISYMRVNAYVDSVDAEPEPAISESRGVAAASRAQKVRIPSDGRITPDG